MVTVTYINLVGAFENLDLTIKYQLSQNWAAENIAVTPNFYSATGSNVPFSWDGVTGIGTDQIHVNEIQDIYDPNDTANGDAWQGFTSEIHIDVFARDSDTLKDFIRAINNIIWKINPSGVSGTTTVKKSDGINASHIDRFEPPFATFRKDPLNNTGEITDKVHASGVLMVRYYKTKS